MKIVRRIILAMVAVSAAFAQQTLEEYHWDKLSPNSGPLPGGLALTIDGKAALKVSNTNHTALVAHLLKIMNPRVSSTLYAITGEIKYDEVNGDGFLEMWNYFPPEKPGGPEGQFFSRTLGLSGEMGKITGSSDWRVFKLPFDRTGSSGPPSRLEVNLVLPGPGTVYLAGVKLLEFKGNGSAGGAQPAAPGWWTERAAGLVGGLGGAFLGCTASLLSWLASRGRARPFVLTMSKFLIGLGIVSLAVGLIAVWLRQPYTVWFPLVLIGVLVVLILPARLRQFHRQYEQLELRRIASLDAVQ